MQPAQKDGIDWRLVLGFWALMALLLMLRPLWLGDRLPLQGDDSMRLVSIAQWLGGGGFQDTTIWRDNTPWGASLHWSRMVDIPLAGLILLLRPFAGAGAEDLASLIWPLLLLLALMGLSALMARRLRLGGSLLPALVLPILYLVTLSEFVPSRVDHHNVQIVLSVALALSVMASRSRAWAAWAAGLLAATSLAIGTETLAFVVVAVVLYALLWAALPERMARPARGFALSFALGVVLHFVIATPPSAYLVVACDVVSIPYVAAGLFSGAALWLSTWLGRGLASPWARLALVSGLGIAAGLATLALYPECLGGPYGQVDPELMRRLFPAIHEALPIWTLMREDPSHATGMMLVPVLALGTTLWVVLRERSDSRVDWAILLAFLAVAVAVAMLQIRGARLIGPFVAPAGMLAINAARERYLAQANAPRALLLVGAWLLFAQAAQQAALHLAARANVGSALAARIEQALTETERRLGCVQPRSYGALGEMPAARIIAPIRVGPHVLRFSAHSIVAAGFHRNTRGVLDNLWFFNGSESEARRIADERGLDYVVTCANFPELPTVETDPTSFSSLESEGRHWDWLTPLSPADEIVQIFRIERSGPAAPPTLRAAAPAPAASG